jgi:hypothetical protein
VSAAERSRRAAAARAARIAATRSTTRPGSETTTLTVGDRVRVRRREGRSGTWARYDGRDGVVVAVNRQTFPNGFEYVEVGVSWAPGADLARTATDAWFRADELEALT